MLGPEYWNARRVNPCCKLTSLWNAVANSPQPLLKILQAHSFPPTALKFNPSATMLVSASADNTIRTVVVPSSFGGGESAHCSIVATQLTLGFQPRPRPSRSSLRS